MSDARRRALERDEKRLGKRLDRSRSRALRTLKRGAELTRNLGRVVLETDKKSSYVQLAREAFGERRVVHRTTSSRLPRTIDNPLFAINQTEAIARDLMGRLRRQSWLASKKRRYLDLALQVFASYRNYVRRRFNTDRCSAAERLGFAPRRLSGYELLSWRQDWGRASIHPLAARSESIEMWNAMRGCAA